LTCRSGGEPTGGSDDWRAGTSLDVEPQRPSESRRRLAIYSHFR
jgi:hypothetical protein